MEENEALKAQQAVIAFVLGIVSLLAVVVAVLALADIHHGENDLRQEWMALRICFALVFISQVFTLITFWKMIRKRTKNG